MTYVDVTSDQCTINFVSSGEAGDWTNYDDVTFTAGSASLAIRGGDVSSLHRGEQDGGVYYTTSGTAENADQQLCTAGMNYVRLRVWVNPADGFDNEAQLLARAKQVAAYGPEAAARLPLLRHLGRPRPPGDPGRLGVGLALAAGDRGLRYSKQIVADLVAQGTPPAMVQVGNEINGGMLCRTGPRPTGRSWPRCSRTGSRRERGRLVGEDRAAPRRVGLRGDVAPGSPTAIAEGVSFDVIGLSTTTTGTAGWTCSRRPERPRREVRQAGLRRGDRLPVHPDEQRPDRLAVLLHRVRS